MTIVATADVHLGMTFTSYPSRRAELAEERYDALERVVDEANALDARLLVVAGDLFHRVSVPARVIERAAAILARFDGGLVLVLPGNHDYLAPDGDHLWTSFREAAGDGTLVLDRAGSFDLSSYDLPVTVLAAPCDARHGATHRLGWAEAFRAVPGQITLGVAHGSIAGITLDSEGAYFPMSRELLASLPADVWIVGHTHGYHDLPDVPLVVPGTPEADGFDAGDRGGAACIEVDGDASSFEYRSRRIETGRMLFVEVDATIEDPIGALSEDELAGLATATVPAADALVRLAVHGTLADSSFARWNAVRARLLREANIMRIDDDSLERVLSRADVDRRYPQASFAHSLLSRLVADGDHEALREALGILEELG